MKTPPPEQLPRLLRNDGRYALDAYDFLYIGLDRAARARHGERGPREQRHVGGGELCEALRDLALERWGKLARQVLGRWGIHRTRDFGEMVFLLVNNGFMSRQESDCIEDFDDVFAFGEAFDDYAIQLDHTGDGSARGG
ncbi:MAG: hypothetical protein JXO22_02280 [Phycisphaerae bacterium]|nr:hypothetical protein [Phycisphaerae bacterium]